MLDGDEGVLNKTLCVYDSWEGVWEMYHNYKSHFTDVSDMGCCHLGDPMSRRSDCSGFCLSRNTCPLVFAAGE